ncbi:hypothetical protein HK096_008564 [Nowakowskiella sp. JEL0078]|nr:hypothetical protein HK096_008564 [Nowakowskiella sp. JEL0078]
MMSRHYYIKDVAPKHMHIHRGRIADIFLDTPECNAHTTATDILWSGTPIITYPKYDFKMCSRVAASVAYASGNWSTKQMERIRKLRFSFKANMHKSYEQNGNNNDAPQSSKMSKSEQYAVNPSDTKESTHQKHKLTKKFTHQGSVGNFVNMKKRIGDSYEEGLEQVVSKICISEFGIDRNDDTNFGDEAEDGFGESSNEGGNGSKKESLKEDWSSQNQDIWEPRGLALDGSTRLKDKSLLGHYMVVNSYDEYLEHAVRLGRSLQWHWKEIGTWKTSNRKIKTGEQAFFVPKVKADSSENLISIYPENSNHPTRILAPKGLLIRLRRRLFLTRDEVPIFDTRRWVRNLECGMEIAFERWEKSWSLQKKKNEIEMDLVLEVISESEKDVENSNKFSKVKSLEKLISNLETENEKHSGLPKMEFCWKSQRSRCLIVEETVEHTPVTDIFATSPVKNLLDLGNMNEGLSSIHDQTQCHSILQSGHIQNSYQQNLFHIQQQIN